jgi:NAD(P)-dependent dehydrogenase (short-subunit alcohol dehydrogenase family)
MMRRVEGKIALVTGGAAGIGAACAQTLAREGAVVFATDIQDERGERLAQAIRDDGGEAHYVHHDVTVEEEWIALIERIVQDHKGLDVLVNNAGIATGGMITECSLESWREMMSVNLDGVFLGTKHSIPAMAESGGGSIIMMSSVAGLKGAPGLTGYNATKGGVRLFSRGVALECAGAGLNVRVNSVHPGIIDTEIWAKMGGIEGDMLDGLMEEGANKINPDDLSAASVPVAYTGQAQDIANGVLFLASDESSYMTGSELVIDGGMCA